MTTCPPTSTSLKHRRLGPGNSEPNHHVTEQTDPSSLCCQNRRGINSENPECETSELQLKILSRTISPPAPVQSTSLVQRSKVIHRNISQPVTCDGSPGTADEPIRPLNRSQPQTLKVGSCCSFKLFKLRLSDPEASQDLIQVLRLPEMSIVITHNL